MINLNLPLKLGKLDHYTIIVPDAAASLQFHTDVLGYQYLRTQYVNAGSAPEGQYDMLNHVLRLPDQEQTLVITEGLRPESIFSRYMEKFGAGIHHIAFQLDDLPETFQFLKSKEIEFTSDDLMIDPVKNLRQAFIHRKHAGYFIELIERTPAVTSSEFTHDNMKRLALTMTEIVNEKAEA